MIIRDEDINGPEVSHESKDKRLCKCGQRPRRRGKSDCLFCHRICVGASRIRRKSDLKVTIAHLHATINKLTAIADPATREAFEARFQTRLVFVLPGPCGGQNGFPATVLGFMANFRLLVMTRDGVCRQVPLDSVRRFENRYGIF